MNDVMIVLTEDALKPIDVQHIVSLHPGDDLHYRVLVPTRNDHNPVSAFIDFLSMGELREAWDEVRRRHPSPEQATASATERLATSVEQFRSLGATADGQTTDGNPIVAVQTLIATGVVREIAVVTYPHAVEDTFHTDWASRARTALNVPVLHLYSGTSELG